MQNLREAMIRRLTEQRDEARAMVKKLDRLINEYSDTERPMPGPSQVTVSNAIRDAVKEKPRTSTEVTDRVMNVLGLPKENRSSVITIIGQRVSAGEFVKDEQLKLRIARPVTAAS
jgi:hypothetical protein